MFPGPGELYGMCWDSWKTIYGVTVNQVQFSFTEKNILATGGRAGALPQRSVYVPRESDPISADTSQASAA